MTLTRSQVVELLERHGLSPSRALGQNFVVDPNTVRRMVRIAGVAEGDHVIEVGPGLGSLTLALADAGARVTAIELDQHLLPALREVVADRAVTIVEGDALQVDWASLVGDRAALVANLPYNVATPLVLDVLDRVPAVDPITVMVQREVAERLAAAPRSKAYGIPSVKVAYWARASIVARVPPTVFIPKPNVESAIVRIERRRDGPATAADVDRVFALVRAGFGQRRKMLRRSLADLVDAETFALAGVRPDARAEELTVEDWGRLAGAP